jgi:hypothetical protein
LPASQYRNRGFEIEIPILRRLGEWDGEGGYFTYLHVCRGLADRLSVSLRKLDRALWRWSKDGYPAR